MAAFNAATPDAPDVRYFSFGAAYRPGLIDTFKLSACFVFFSSGMRFSLPSLPERVGERRFVVIWARLTEIVWYWFACVILDGRIA